MFTILNPCPQPIKAQFDGASYLFRPQERKEIFNSFAAKHILNRWGKYGLVDITYSEKAAAKFQDFELFVHEQALKGLTKALETITEQYQGYLNFDEECGDKKTVERLRFKNQAKEVKRELDALEQFIEHHMDVDTQDIIDKKIALLLKQAEQLKIQAGKLSGNNSGKSTQSSKT